MTQNPISYIRTALFRCSMRRIAAIAGVNQSTVFRWERGEGMPTLDAIAKLRVAALNEGLDWDDEQVFNAALLPSREEVAA